MVLKFGGAALRDVDGVQRAAGLVRRFGGDRPVVVVSALEGVTRELRRALREPREADAVWARLRVRHRSVLSGLGLSGDLLDRLLFDLRAVLGGLEEGAKPGDARLFDFVLSFGERMSARVVAAALSAGGMAAIPVDAYDAGVVLSGPGALFPPRTLKARVHRALVGGPAIPVVTGFVALDEAGHVATLGSNGSDLSAVWIGAALEADEVQLWKCVPGILRADPRLVPGAGLVTTISRAHATELARHGADVLHPAALAPLEGLERELVVSLRDVRAPEAAGTRVVAGPTGPREVEGPLAIAHREDVLAIEVDGSRGPWLEQPDREPGTAGTDAQGLLPVAAMLERFAGAGVECLGCQVGPKRLRALVVAEGEAAAALADLLPEALRRRARVRGELACVTLVGQPEARAGRLADLLLASARDLDPEAEPWHDGGLLRVLLRCERAADLVCSLHAELFRADRLERSEPGGRISAG